MTKLYITGKKENKKWEKNLSLCECTHISQEKTNRNEEIAYLHSDKLPSTYRVVTGYSMESCVFEFRVLLS